MTVTVQFRSSGTVMFQDGRFGSYVIYHTDDYRYYVYRQNPNPRKKSELIRVYIKPGQSVEWMEVS